MYFLVENQNLIDLVTYEWFSEKHCHKKYVKAINSFNKTSQNWTFNLTSLEKFRNLHKCLIITETGQIQYPHSIDRKLTGFLFELFDIVAQHGNFLAHRQPNQRFFKYFKHNALYDPDVKIFTDSLMSIIFERYHLTTTFGEIVNNFMISSAESFTSYEKMLLPFDKYTWFMIILMFCSSFLIILVVNHMPIYTQMLFYCDKNKTPLLNVMRIFFGIPQPEQPDRSFSRIILIFFVYYCLVVRTAYQGVFYEMLTSDMKKDLPTKIDELFKRNYTIYIRNGTSAGNHLIENIWGTKR